jgi:hypothetical protein
MNTPTIIPAKRRVRRKRKQGASAEPAPPVALNLVAATYDPGLSVTLTFDRAIDVSGFNGSFVIVRDGDNSFLYDAMGGAVLMGPNVVELTLVLVEGDSSVGVTMTVSPENGIVAVDDGGAWGGASDVELPFP